MSNKVRLTAIMISKTQMRWLNKQREVTGQPYSVIVRTLINKEIEKSQPNLKENGD